MYRTRQSRAVYEYPRGSPYERFHTEQPTAKLACWRYLRLTGAQPLQPAARGGPRNSYYVMRGESHRIPLTTPTSTGQRRGHHIDEHIIVTYDHNHEESERGSAVYTKSPDNPFCCGRFRSRRQDCQASIYLILGGKYERRTPF